MATYYKYAERAANSQVNWAEIGKNLTDTLNEENKLREQKKAAIDEATRQYGLELEKSPQGDDASLNQWGLDFASQAQEARLLQDRLLKSGKLKLKDYTVMRQNITDGTNQAFNLMEEYNAEYKEKMERFKATDPANASQLLESWLMEQAEGFANFKKSQLYINPNNFQVNVAMKTEGPDGVMTMSHNPNDFTTVNALRNRIKARYDKFDSDKYLAQQVALLGTEISAELKSGTSTKVGQKLTVEDITERPGVKEAISVMIDAGLNSPTNVSSVLTNDLGKDSKGNTFSFTFNKDEMGKITTDKKNLIYLENIDGKLTPQFTEDQKKTAKDYMLNKFNTMLTRKEDIDVYTEPRPVSTGGGGGGNIPTEGQSKAAGLGNLIGYLYSGDQGQIDSAITALKNMEGVQDVQRFRDRVEIKFEGDSEYRPFKFGSTIEDFVRSFGYALDPKNDLNAMVSGAYNIGNPVLNEGYETGPDFIGQFPNGYNPNNPEDQKKMQALTDQYNQRKKEYNSRSRQGGGGGQKKGILD